MMTARPLPFSCIFGSLDRLSERNFGFGSMFDGKHNSGHARVGSVCEGIGYQFATLRAGFS